MFTTNVCRCALVVFHCVSISAIASADLVHSNRVSSTSAKQNRQVIATLDLSKTLAKSMTTNNISISLFSSATFSSAHGITLPAVFASKEKSDVRHSSKASTTPLNILDIYKAVSHHHHDGKSGDSHLSPFCDPVAVPEPSALLLSLSSITWLGARMRHSRHQRNAG